MSNKTFQDEYAKLNPQQKTAVDTIEGPVMVIAGPGTGKTQIIAMRIANILDKTQINASNILCLTFTNSGVQAMKQRLLQIIGPLSYQIHVHTFHSFCNEIINAYPEKFLTAKKINQLTDLEQIQLIQKILQANNYQYIKPFKSPFHYQKSIISAIGNLKQENITPDKFLKIIKNELENFDKIDDLYHEKGTYKDRMKAKYETLKADLQKNLELADIYEKYINELQSQGKYDYADMILFVLNALQNDPEILAIYQEKYQYILVDEYQDTNSAQNAIIQILGSFYENPNVFVVGDDEQSIFRFQGASLENILFFKEIYPATQIIVLENNYRSIQKILDVSRAIIKNNQNQISSALKIEKKLKSQLEKIDGNVEVGEFSHGSIESFFIAKKINELINPPHSNTSARHSDTPPRHSGLDPESSPPVIAEAFSPVIASQTQQSTNNQPPTTDHPAVPPHEIAVLYKEHRDAEELIDFLSKLNIPYILEIGGDILEDPEIDKIIAYLKALNFGVKQSDNQTLLEIMHFPFFGLSPLDIYKIVIEANKESRAQRILGKSGKYIFDIITSNKTLDTLELDEPAAIKEFVKTFLECRNLANSTTFASAFEHIINATGYLNYLLSLGESVHHLNRLRTLFDEIKNLNTKNKHLKLSGFLEYIELLQENDLPIKQKELSATYEGIRLMTAHKSKGLEFEYVFLIHATDKHWGNKTKKELIKLPGGILQTKASSEENDEEERRLFYVALTRAKKHIFLTYANSYGDIDSPTLTIPSKFLAEIPQDHLSKINTKKYEDQFDERLRLTFAAKKWQPSEKLEDFLRELIKEFKLSPTALNSYLECPQRFFYDNILRVPKTKDFTQSYGTAVHKALELLFKKFKHDFTLPAKEEFIKYFTDALTEEIFTDEDQKRAFQRGVEILSQYYDFYSSDWQARGVPISCEMDFGSHEVYYNDIPITGKIDRIDLIDKISNQVRIIDYKTSAPKSQNFLMGQTKEKNTDYLYQAYFYKLLADTDPNFSWKVGEIEFDFISPESGSQSKFKKVALPVDPKQYEEFKKTVEQVYDKIVNLDFHLEEQACKTTDGHCPYFNICHSNNNKL